MTPTHKGRITIGNKGAVFRHLKGQWKRGGRGINAAGGSKRINPNRLPNQSPIKSPNNQQTKGKVTNDE